ncbi:MAG: ATP-binding protein [Prevotella sp.]|nr:ATP-binding protein [Staphylococcus sp.]MCM1349742.1 ATP-binding protein [Prevotella sp.]
MNTIHLMVGIQGSGKTTFAKQLAAANQIQIVSTDSIRMNYPNTPEKEIWPLAYRFCAEELKQGKDVIFDATSITPAVRARLKEEVQRYFASFEIGCYFFLPDLALCKERVKSRNQIQTEHYLPVEVVEQYYHRLIPPTIDEGFQFVKTIDVYGTCIQVDQSLDKISQESEDRDD